MDNRGVEFSQDGGNEGEEGGEDDEGSHSSRDESSDTDDGLLPALSSFDQSEADEDEVSYNSSDMSSYSVSLVSMSQHCKDQTQVGLHFIR